MSKPFNGHTDCITSLTCSPDGKCIALGSLDGTIRVWDAETGNMSGPFKGHQPSYLSRVLTERQNHGSAESGYGVQGTGMSYQPQSKCTPVKSPLLHSHQTKDTLSRHLSTRPPVCGMRKRGMSSQPCSKSTPR